ncbi:cell wall hydrolase [Sphingomicrobium clamense]|uniref:Cell wall hydrolase n=1 Tax=Sphingomicrobium clamense TaxID=2851013 RepID=A0ABS6V4P1_9SPHN|nr:cell wall hydrolase [Sphingomicrobium sp. B8]MBW0144523.1 cell wall hydrolase [Sphingomicrobium sp. B8]
MFTTGGSEALAATVQSIPVINKIVESKETDIEEAIEEAEVLDSKSLPELVEDYKDSYELDRQGKCLATAVYFEARGESLEGQLAVADVVLNRADSEQYPDDWCDVVKQKAQFSFVQNRQFPKIRDMQSWEKAKAVARIAIDGAEEVVRGDVLWYHADYVKPIWRHNLSEVTKVGVHIFYNA